MVFAVRILSLYLILMSLNSCRQRESNTAQNKETKKNEEAAASGTPESKGSIIFFGNSLTAGYGLDSQKEAFPALIQHKIDSAGLNYQCVNAGLSGETSAGGLERIDWILRQPVDIFVLELGANDGLRGIAPESTYRNLSAIVEKVKEAYPDCKLILAGMKIPPSMGQDHFDQFEAIFPRLAEDHDMHLIEFLLDGVAGVATLNQQDGVHPTPEGQKIMAENVWEILETLL